MVEVLKTKHNLPFESRPWIMGQFIEFRVGTCHGLWKCRNNEYQILAIENDEKGNGHLDDVFQWFENSCKRDKFNLAILEVWNRDFKKHLIKKRGFKLRGKNDVIKII